MMLLGNSILFQIRAEGIDYQYREQHNFDVSEHDGIYNLTSDVKITNQYLSKSSLDKKVYFISESYTNVIKKIKAYCNGSKISDNQIGFHNAKEEDVFITDSKTHYLSFENLKQGDQIEYSYQAIYNDIVFSPIINIPNYTSVEQFRIQFDHPDNLTVDFEFFFPNGSQAYKIIKESDRTILQFDSLKNIAESEFNPFTKSLGYILIIIKKDGIPINGITPDQFTKWYLHLTDYHPALLPENKYLFDSLFNNTSATSDRLEIINKYVRENIRYIADERGNNNIVPRLPNDVIDRKYGDCKDRAFLVSAIAAAYGIKVSPALISTGPQLDFSSIHASLFNHIICHYNDGNKNIWFDPTAKYYEFGVLSKNELYKKAFILDTLNPRYITISADSLLPEICIKIIVNPDSPSLCNARVSLTNNYCAYFRYAMKEMNSAKSEHFLSSLLKQNINGLVISDFNCSDSSLVWNKNRVTISARADLSNFIISSAKKKYINKTPFKLFNNEIITRGDDTLSVYLDQSSILILQIILENPTYHVRPDSLNLSDRGSGIQFTAKTITAANGMTGIEYYYNPPGIYLDNQNKLGLIKFCKKYFGNQSQMFVIKGKES